MKIRYPCSVSVRECLGKNNSIYRITYALLTVIAEDELLIFYISPTSQQKIHAPVLQIELHKTTYN